MSRVDPRPVDTAAGSQKPLIVGGASLSGGLPGLYLALAPQPYGRLDVLIVIALAAAPSVFTGLLALARTVRRAEPETTPWRDARDDQDRPLTPPDVDLVKLLRQNLRMQGAPERPQRRTADGTRVGAPVESARSMTVEDAGPYRATQRPPSRREAWEPEVDYYADQAHAYDEQRARQQPPRGGRSRHLLSGGATGGTQ